MKQIQTKRIKFGFMPIEILTIRFLLLTIVTGIITWFTKEKSGYDSVYMTMISITVVAVTVIIVPQLAYQKAIRELQPITVAMVLPLMPVMTYFIEFFDSRLNPTIYPIMGILGVFGITLISSVYRFYFENKAAMNTKN